jgi:hypothetical protein
VLGDPARRAAYDQALAREQTPPSASWPPELAVVTAAARMPGALPLWAGPVRVERPHRAPGQARRQEEEARLAVLAGLALHYLARDWNQLW